MDDSSEAGLGSALQGQYANYCRIGQNVMEFVIDFGQRYGEADPPIFHTRIVTTPIAMRTMLAAFEEAVALYRQRVEPTGDR